MDISKGQTLREMPLEQLEELLESTRKKFFEMRTIKNIRKGTTIEKPHFFKKYKKDIARILTVIKERKPY